jgi:hypothetical protein
MPSEPALKTAPERNNALALKDRRALKARRVVRGNSERKDKLAPKDKPVDGKAEDNNLSSTSPSASR